MSFFKSVLCCLTLFICFRTDAQTYVGISANLGNQMHYTPDSKGLKRPLSISGGLLLNVREELKNGWGIQYGAGLGILGYNLKIISIDTLFPGEDTSVFLEYATFYGNLNLLVCKEISISEKKVIIGLGGGASYYYCPFPITTYGIGVMYNDNTVKELFYAEINCPKNKIAAFAKITAQLKLTSSIIVGLEYSYHFKPVSDGFYEFYHTKTPSVGKISLYQRELSAVFLVKVSRGMRLANNANGQNKTYFGFEFAVANDIYKIKDNGDYLKTIPLINGPGGFNIRQEINKHIFIETGLIVKYYWEGFGFKTIAYNSSTSSDNSWLIPVRFGLNMNLYKGKIHLVPVIGYSFGINPPYGYGLGYGTQKSSTTVINYNYTENPNSSRYFSLLQTGVGFEFKLFQAPIFSISANYYSGFNKIIQLDINYTVNNSTPMTGVAISKGEFWSVSTGLKYPISNFWARK